VKTEAQFALFKVCCRDPALPPMRSPSEMLRDQRQEDSRGRRSEANDVFRRRMVFISHVGVAFTCLVHLMTLLRPVLEPFLWALFLVMTLQPLTSMFDTGLQGFCCWVCRSRHTCLRRLRRRYGSGSSAYSPAAGEERQGALPLHEDSGLSGEDDMDILCVNTAAPGISRIVAVLCALTVLVSVIAAVVMMVFDACLRVRASFGVYEKGVDNAMEAAQSLLDHITGRVPRHVYEPMCAHVLSGVKGIVSDLITCFLSHTGKIMIELVMLVLYVLFWLCAPMPLDTGAGKIFRRYLLLKGGACLAYGVCVGLLLRILDVDIPSVFGLLSFLFSFIPKAGALIAMVLPIPVILFDSRLEAPVLTLVIATLGQLAMKFVFANIIEVMLMDNDATMKIHPVVTVFAFCFFAFLWGPTGMLLSVPLMAYLKALVLSDFVPPTFRDPILIIIEGDLDAPSSHQRLAAASQLEDP